MFKQQIVGEAVDHLGAGGMALGERQYLAALLRLEDAVEGENEAERFLIGRALWAGLGIVDVSTKEADLEDVFLALTRAA